MKRGLILSVAVGCVLLASCSLWPWGERGGDEPAGAIPERASEERGSEERRSWWSLDWFGLGGNKEATDRRVRGLELEVKTEPAEVRVGETRRVTVTVSLVNRSGRLANLSFPSSQRLELLWRDATGAVVTRWSEDQSFARASGHLVINPGERVEYSETLATRDLRSGRPYTLEVYIPAYPGLKRSVDVRPKG